MKDRRKNLMKKIVRKELLNGEKLVKIITKTQEEIIDKL
jgi:hypothetical protein